MFAHKKSLLGIRDIFLFSRTNEYLSTEITSSDAWDFSTNLLEVYYIEWKKNQSIAWRKVTLKENDIYPQEYGDLN